ncbi:MAG: hypothetical protein IVW51_14250 [Thermaceae bacterium]|nr:hypothetical protein [Thermaceae bacterium]
MFWGAPAEGYDSKANFQNRQPSTTVSYDFYDHDWTISLLRGRLTNIWVEKPWPVQFHIGRPVLRYAKDIASFLRK